MLISDVGDFIVAYDMLIDYYFIAQSRKKQRKKSINRFLSLNSIISFTTLLIPTTTTT